MSVHKKLMEARIRLQNTELKKTGHNKFAGYSYFELGDFLPTVQTIFNDIGLCGVISFSPDVATLTITDTESNGSIFINSPMAEANLKGCHPIQNLGAVETYTRRYLWVTALEIVEHDVLDATTGSEDKKPEKRGTTRPANPGNGDGLPEESKLKVMEAVGHVQALLQKGMDFEAYEAKQKASLDVDETLHFWTHFDSKQRAALKSIYDSLKKTYGAENLDA